MATKMATEIFLVMAMASSAESGLGIGRQNDWSKQLNGQPWGSTSGKISFSISDIMGSPFGNGNGNGSK